jgi:glycosyltransferase involved in cell wall biosynthesis
MLLRGVVGEDIIAETAAPGDVKRNRILFSGTHSRANAVDHLIKAWDPAAFDGWELHITGNGEMTPMIKQLAKGKERLVFHGMVDRKRLVELLCSAKICVNPYAASKTPGNIFAFKTIEYLAAGAHVLTTPMGSVETELEKGITYMADNTPDCIRTSLLRVIAETSWRREAAKYVCGRYSLAAVSVELQKLLNEALKRRNVAADVSKGLRLAIPT